MAAINLLPGFGGQYTATFTAVSTNSTGSDTIDCSKCYTLGVSITSTSTSGTNSILLQQTFDPSTLSGWVNLATVISASSTGVYPATLGPFGIVRIKNANVANGTMTVGITGFPIPRSW